MIVLMVKNIVAFFLNFPKSEPDYVYKQFAYKKTGRQDPFTSSAV